MKNYLSKQYRTYSALSKKGKKETIGLSIASIIIYIASAFAIFCAIYNICNILGAIVCDSPWSSVEILVRTAPSIVGCLGLIYVMSVIHRFLKTTSNERNMKLIFKSGIVFIVIGLIVSLYIIIGLGTGLYHKAVEGFPTPLFPLDLMLFGFIYVAAGVLFIIFSKKTHKEYQTEIAITPDNRRLPQKIAEGIGTTIFYIASASALAILIYGIWSIDFNIGYGFFIAALFFSLLVPVAMLVVYKFVYLPLKEEYKLEFQLKFSIIFLTIGIITSALFIVASMVDKNAANWVCYGMFPIQFASKFNVYTYLYMLVNILTPAICLGKALYNKFKKH